MEPDRKPKVIYVDNSLEFGKACEDLSWNHCTSTPHRSETNEIAERAVRRVTEGTSAVLLQSGLKENWWADSMECYTYLRNVTPMKDVLDNHLKDRLFHSVHWLSITLSLRRTSQESTNLERKFYLDCSSDTHCTRGGIWKDDILVAVLEELETMDASEIYSKRLNAKEVIFPKQGEFNFPIADGRLKPLEEIKTWEHPPWYGSDQFEEKVTLIFLENQKGLFHHLTTRFRMPVKQLMTSCPCQETSYTAITSNPGSSFTRREKNHSFFHWSTLTSPELHTQIWMSSKKNASMIIGISMGQEIWLIIGQVSLNLLYWKRSLQTDTCCPGGD